MDPGVRRDDNWKFDVIASAAKRFIDPFNLSMAEKWIATSLRSSQ